MWLTTAAAVGLCWHRGSSKLLDEAGIRCRAKIQDENLKNKTGPRKTKNVLAGVLVVHGSCHRQKKLELRDGHHHCCHWAQRLGVGNTIKEQESKMNRYICQWWCVDVDIPGLGLAITAIGLLGLDWRVVVVGQGSGCHRNHQS